jgi:hypothetical protein
MVSAESYLNPVHVVFILYGTDTVYTVLSHPSFFVSHIICLHHVADPGCLYLILDPNFPSRIQGPKDLGPRIRIFNPRTVFFLKYQYQYQKFCFREATATLEDRRN